jgi:septal ring factor EnvC (AmiA/AmiB activator)
VLVHGGGTRMLHLRCPRWLVRSLFLALTSFVALLAGTWWDYFALKRAQLQAASVERRVEEQRATLDSVEVRVAELNREVGGWQAAHLRVWSTFGPSPASAMKSGGMGGAMAVLPLVFATEAPALPQALALLSSSVNESGQSLRALERYVERTRPILMALPLRWPVRAPASGVVAFAGDGGEYGNTVILDHGRDLRSLYGHLSEIRVKHGARIERGEVIALTGNTGRTSGPHLHYEIQIHGQAVDPRQFLWD